MNQTKIGVFQVTPSELGVGHTTDHRLKVNMQGFRDRLRGQDLELVVSPADRLMADVQIDRDDLVLGDFNIPEIVADGVDRIVYRDGEGERTLPRAA